MELYFADWSAVEVLDSTLLDPDEARCVNDGTPIIVDDQMRPIEPLCTFLRLYSENIGLF